MAIELEHDRFADVLYVSTAGRHWHKSRLSDDDYYVIYEMDKSLKVVGLTLLDASHITSDEWHSSRVEQEAGEPLYDAVARWIRKRENL